MTTLPSPRERHDYLLLHTKPSATTILEAFATAEGVVAYRGFENLVSRTSVLLPDLAKLISTLPADLVASRVCMALDGVAVEKPESGELLDGLLGDGF